jgi:hypothetical protein
MAVAPDSFLRNFEMRDFMAGSDLVSMTQEQRVPCSSICEATGRNLRLL